MTIIMLIISYNSIVLVVIQLKVDEFFEMVSVTVDTYVQLFTEGNITTFSSSDEAHFLLALAGVITSK